MALKINTAPTLEPITLAEAKVQLRLESDTFADHITSVQSIAPGAHVIAATYSLLGTSVEVLGYSVVVQLESGTNGTGGTVDVKLQESDSGSTWTDVTSGAFTQVTTANDNATYEKAYTGTKRYLRVVATVGTATCDFGVSIIKGGSESVEDDLIEALITTAREYCEGFQNRAFINQTWELWLDAWPNKDYIEIPLPPLSSVTSLKYYDTADAETIAYEPAGDPVVDDGTYFTDAKSEPGRFCLKYSQSWPSTTLRPHNGICVTFVAGYGSAASAVPLKVKQAMLLAITHLYEHRGDDNVPMPPAVDNLLWLERVGIV